MKHRKDLLACKPVLKQALAFACLQYQSFKNTVGTEQIPRNEQFLLFSIVFLSIWRTFCHFIQFEIVVCKLFQFGSV